MQKKKKAGAQNSFPKTQFAIITITNSINLYHQAQFLFTAHIHESSWKKKPSKLDNSEFFLNNPSLVLLYNWKKAIHFLLGGVSQPNWKNHCSRDWIIPPKKNQTFKIKKVATGLRFIVHCIPDPYRISHDLHKMGSWADRYKWTPKSPFINGFHCFFSSHINKWS